jgi:hypothetical protein
LQTGSLRRCAALTICPLNSNMFGLTDVGRE